MRYFTPKNRAILREMVVTDFKVRYQGSALGYLWSLLKPLFLFAILYVIFTYIMPVGRDLPHYAVTLLLGIVFWNFFAETTMIGASSVVAHGDLIRKISIPRYLVVLASSCSALINLALSLVVVIVFAAINGVYPSLSWLLLPVIIIELLIFGLGVAFVLSTAYVKYRDVTYVWEVVLQAGFYASAILFPIKMVPEHWQMIFFSNPIVQIVQDARRALVPIKDNITIWDLHEPLMLKLVPFAIIITVFIIGVVYFRRQSKYFAENV